MQLEDLNMTRTGTRTVSSEERGTTEKSYVGLDNYQYHLELHLRYLILKPHKKEYGSKTFSNY